jgi:hypothetical protein
LDTEVEVVHHLLVTLARDRVSGAGRREETKGGGGRDIDKRAVVLGGSVIGPRSKQVHDGVAFDAVIVMPPPPRMAVVETILVNGKPVGEIEARAALAGAFNTPVIFLGGDQAAADDLHAIVPEAELAVVKKGYGEYTCLSLYASAAQSLIRERATLAMKRISEIKPYKIEEPVTVQIEYAARSVPGLDAKYRPGVEVVDARTLRFHGNDFVEAWTRAEEK